MHVSDTHAAQSNIQAGISSVRAICEPSNVQRKTPLSLLVRAVNKIVAPEPGMKPITPLATEPKLETWP